MWRRGWSVVICIALSGMYSCHFIMRTRAPASSLILGSPVFSPSGPRIRVRLRRLSEHARSEGGVTLAAEAPVLAVFADGKQEPAEFGPCEGILRFIGQNVVWDIRRGLPGPFAARARVRLQSADGFTPLRINGDPYPGTLDLDPATGLVVNELDFESYLLGVVGNEMPAWFALDALRAQAIASRTYALYNWRFKGAHHTWHVDDTTFSQVYRGHAEVHPRVRRTVAETCGLVMTFMGKVFQAYFHSTCGGNTTRAAGTGRFWREPDIPPLSGAECTFCEKSPLYTWIADYNEKEVRAALQEALRSESPAPAPLGVLTRLTPEPPPDRQDIYAQYIRVHHRPVQDPAGPETSLRVLASFLTDALNRVSRGSCKSPGIQSGRVEAGVLHIRGRGFGHGVGMCQWGAEGQARAGRDFAQILQYYYPEIAFTQAWTKAGPTGGAAGGAPLP